MGSHSLLQGIVQTKESNSGLLHCKWILYHLSHQRNYYVLYSFSSVQSLSHVQLFATPWARASLASLSITNSQSLSKLISRGQHYSDTTTRQGCHRKRKLEANIPAVGLPGGSDGKESTCNAGDPGLIPGSGRCPGKGNGNPLQYSTVH